MKQLLLLLACLFPATLFAQVEVKLKLEQDTFLPGETLNVKLHIGNFSGRKLVFGKDPQWIKFHVEAIEGSVVSQLAEVPEYGSFPLESSTGGDLRFDLQPVFDLSRPGRYRLTATVATPEREDVLSSAVIFEVIRGSRLWDKEFGLPGTGEPERRKYLLQQANHLREVRLYVRVTDATESTTFKVIPIGRMISFAKPDQVIDRKACLHLITQMSSDSYVYLVIDPDGTVLKREVYTMTERRPKIRMNDVGEVSVIGGQRRDAPVAPVEALSKPAPAKQDEPKRDSEK